MLYEQRAPQPEEQTGGDEFWRPHELGDIAPQSGDTYLVVDDQIVGTLRLVAAPWPRLDQRGRLVFERSHRRRSESQEVFFADEQSFHDAVEPAREIHHQINRDIRVGDAFWVRGLEPLPAAHATSAPAVSFGLASWLDVVDVTHGARVAAKTALYAAVAPTVTPGQAEELSLVGDEDEPPPPSPPSGPTAPAAV